MVQHHNRVLGQSHIGGENNYQDCRRKQNRFWVQDIDEKSLPESALDLSRFSAAPGARLSHLPFESDRAFPAQC